MSDANVLPFPSDDGNDPAMPAQLESRLHALYAATPMPEASQADRCARTVLAEAMHRRSRSVLGIPSVRWWWGAAAAAVIIAATTFSWPSSTKGPLDDPALTVASADPVLVGAVTTLAGNDVRFDLKLPSHANEVAIVGDFNGWDETATPMARRNGEWSAKVPLPPGRHVYAFVIDGERWVVDPLAPQVPDDGFGPTNAVVIDRGPK